MSKGIRIPRERVPDLVKEIGIEGKGQITICGSYRRGRADVGDIDIVIIPNEDFYLWQIRTFGIQKNGKPAKRKIIDGRQFELYITNEKQLPYCLQYATGCGEHNVEMRSIAKSKGWLLNEKGLFIRDTDILVNPSIKTEEDLYIQIIGEYIKPEDRTPELQLREVI